MPVDLLWLNDLYEDLDGNIEIRCFAASLCPACKGGGCERCIYRRFAPTVEAAEALLNGIAKRDGFNVYVGMATRAGTKGDKTDTKQCRALWIDYDYAQPGDEDMVDSKMESFPNPPSIVVNSGGGRHLYWLMEEPQDVSTDAGREWLENTLKGLQTWFDSDNKVVDAARIMRVPGTLNVPDEKKRKKGRGVAACEVVQRSGALYQPEDFEDWTDRGRQARAEQGRLDVAGLDYGEVPDRVRVAFEQDERARRLFQRDESVLRCEDKSGSIFDIALMSALRRHNYLTQSDVIAAAKLSRIRAGDGNTDKLAREAYWIGTYEKSSPTQERRRQLDSMKYKDRAAWLRAVIRQPETPSPIEELTIDPAIHKTPRYPTGIGHLDEALDGGYHGVTTIMGKHGVGKSTVMMNAALASALDGWHVVYLDSENADSVFNRRAMSWFKNVPIPDIQRRLAGSFRRCRPNKCTMDEMRDHILASVVGDVDRLLIVFDSLNTLLLKMSMRDGRRTNYWDLYHDMLMWMQDVRLVTEGNVGFLLASEVNKEAEAMGRKLQYTTEVMLRVESKGGDAMMLSLEKTRETRKPDGLPNFVRDEHWHIRPDRVAEEPIDAEGEEAQMDAWEDIGGFGRKR